MISFFQTNHKTIYAVQSEKKIPAKGISKLEWLFENAKLISEDKIKNNYIGPRAAMVSPWSTNAVEITQNMGLESINRIEQCCFSFYFSLLLFFLKKTIFAGNKKLTTQW